MKTFFKHFEPTRLTQLLTIDSRLPTAYCLLPTLSTPYFTAKKSPANRQDFFYLIFYLLTHASSIHGTFEICFIQHVVGG